MLNRTIESSRSCVWAARPGSHRSLIASGLYKMGAVMKVVTLFLVSISAVAVTATAGITVDMTGPRTIRIDGAIGEEALAQAHRIERMSHDSREDINLLINSPGGSVLAGLQLLESVRVAKSRGVNVRCAVSTLAASMAFILLSECSERYALGNSLLLFHPVRVMLYQAVLKAEDAARIALEISAANDEVSDILEESMGVATAQQKSWYQYHFNAETLWSASRLISEVPASHWLVIVSDIKADGGIFGHDTNGKNAEGIRNCLTSRGIL